VINDYKCHYDCKENKWFVYVDTVLSLPESELKNIGERLRRHWIDKLRNMDGLKDTLKMSFIRRALQALDNNHIAQVWSESKNG
jgi:hypothetical protein